MIKMSSAEQIYQVREILAKRELRKGTYYKISWEGFPSSHDNWEPEANLIGCETLLEKFNQKSWSPVPEPSPKDEEAAPPPKTPKEGTKSSRPKPEGKPTETVVKTAPKPEGKPTETVVKTAPKPEGKPTETVVKTAPPKTYNLRSTSKPPPQLSQLLGDEENFISGSSPSKETNVHPRISLTESRFRKRYSELPTTATRGIPKRLSENPKTTTTTTIVISSTSRPFKSLPLPPDTSPPVSSRVRTRLEFPSTTSKMSLTTSRSVHQQPELPTAQPLQPPPTTTEVVGEERERSETKEEMPGWLQIGWAETLLAMSVVMVMGVGYFAYC